MTQRTPALVLAFALLLGGLALPGTAAADSTSKCFEATFEDPFFEISASLSLTRSAKLKHSGHSDEVISEVTTTDSSWWNGTVEADLGSDLTLDGITKLFETNVDWLGFSQDDGCVRVDANVLASEITFPPLWGVCSPVATFDLSLSLLVTSAGWPDGKVRPYLHVRPDVAGSLSCSVIVGSITGTIGAETDFAVVPFGTGQLARYITIDVYAGAEAELFFSTVWSWNQTLGSSNVYTDFVDL